MVQILMLAHLSQKQAPVTCRRPQLIVSRPQGAGNTVGCTVGCRKQLVHSLPLACSTCSTVVPMAVCVPLGSPERRPAPRKDVRYIRTPFLPAAALRHVLTQPGWGKKDKKDQQTQPTNQQRKKKEKNNNTPPPTHTHTKTKTHKKHTHTRTKQQQQQTNKQNDRDVFVASTT